MSLLQKKQFLKKAARRNGSGKSGSRGITLIEMLVVVLILGISAVTLAMVMKTVVFAFERTKRMESAKAQAQAAHEYLAKLARMSAYVNTGTQEVEWHKPSGHRDYVIETKELDETEIERFFPGAEIKHFNFEPSGANGDNKGAISFYIVVPDRDPNKEGIKIPFQAVVTFRNQ